jgi:hypothetical protein
VRHRSSSLKLIATDHLDKEGESERERDLREKRREKDLMSPPLSQSPLLSLLSLLSLLLLCSHGLSAEERQSEGMTFTVHRSPVSDVALSPCDVSVAYGYRERVEDAQVLLDSSLKHQQGICHMHAVFVAWDAPHLTHQVG